jgi:hypothetical protein
MDTRRDDIDDGIQLRFKINLDAEKNVLLKKFMNSFLIFDMHNFKTVQEFPNQAFELLYLKRKIS